MPLLAGATKKIMGQNMHELMSGKPGATRAKGIATLAKSRGVSKKKARSIQAVAIMLSKARQK